jgi:8-oxo-dGTP pyrophosphatase MutT (NUDIX family)
MKKVASIAVTSRDGSIMFLRRSDVGKWTLPGGHFEDDEKPAAAAVRELWEETGLDVKQSDLEYLGFGVVRGKYEVHCFKLEKPAQPIHFDNDPDEEADDYCFFGSRDSDYSDDLPEAKNSYVPPKSNVTLILMGLEENDGSVEIKEKLAKMAIADLKPGERTYNQYNETTYDYSHLLPKDWGKKLKLFVTPGKDDMGVNDGGGPMVYTHLEDPEGNHVGHVKSYIDDWDTETPSIEPHSDLEDSYHGNGLGKAMYEALYTHAYHNMNIKKVRGGMHTNAASRVHEALARIHGMNYEAKPALDASRRNEINTHKRGYTYTIKSEELLRPLVESLTNDLRKPKYRESPNPMTGHCYVASEAMFHLLGGKDSGWVPHNIKHEGDQHWYLKNKTTGAILDPTASQFKTPVPYQHGRGKGFLTKEPSKRAQELITRVKTKMASGNDPTLPKDPLDALQKGAPADVGMSPDLKAAFDKVQTAQVQKLPATPKPPEDPNFTVPAQPPKWTPDGLHNYLIPIAHLESSFGKNMNHIPHAKGEYHTAFGPLGFKPVTAQEEWGKTKKLKELYPGLEDPAAFMAKFKGDWKFYNLLASSHFMRLMHRHGSPEKAAYAWRWGTGAASGADDDKINADNYVMRYRDLSASTGIQKSDPLTKMAIKDLKPGERVAPEHSWLERRYSGPTYDYTHVLPKHHRKNYRMYVTSTPEGSVRASVWHNNEVNNVENKMDSGVLKPASTVVGGVSRGFKGLNVDTAETKPAHQGLGLGMAAYEALYAHAYHNMGVRSVYGDQHSTLAARTHQKLADKHGLNYPHQQAPIDAKGGINKIVGRPFDGRFGAYDYKLK